MITKRTIETSVDWPDFENGVLYVRGKPLLQLVEQKDFVEMIFHAWLNKMPTDNEKRMFNAVMVSFCGGWSFLPPTVFTARAAASTRAPMAQCLAAGFCASGPLHTSAIEGAMRTYLEVDDLEAHVSGLLARGEKLPGFGHPAVKKDPRPQTMRRLASEYWVAGEAVAKFDRLSEIMHKRKKIHPNVDAINGAILVDLGFRNPAFGPAAFMIGRAIGMAAHVIEEYEQEPYHIMSPLNASFHEVRYKGFMPIETAMPSGSGLIPVRVTVNGC